MASVLQLKKLLIEIPQLISLQGISVRSYFSLADIEPWLKLRDSAFARERTGVRKWSHGDFVEEFLQRWWWQPERMWLAEADIDDSAKSAGKQMIGSVTLAMRGEPENARPVVHWLMVHPRWRRHGIGRLLMAHLEFAAWDAGFREVWLETHSGWEAAARFYETLGYKPAV